MAKRVSEQELIDDLWDLADDLEKVPTAKEFDRLADHSTTTYQSRFGSWSEALEAAGLPERGAWQDPEPYQDESVLREMYVDREMTQEEMADELGVGDSTISNYLTEHGIEREDPPWRDAETLRTLYWDEDLSIRQIAERLDTHEDVIHRWMVNLDVPRETASYDRDYPWQDEDTLRKLYFDEDMSQREIAERFDTTQSMISSWFRRFDIPTPVGWKAANESWRTIHPYFMTTRSGYEIARSRVGDETHTVHIHKLVSIAEHGFDGVSGKVVHHINTIPWDNRPENLIPMGDSEHKRLHRTHANEPISESGLIP